MTVFIISFLLYMLGYVLFFMMLRTEQEADGEAYTIGDRAACIVLSLFSWAAILVILIITWVRMIQKTGYWDRPVKDEPINDTKE
jgi:hypothetical protein